MAKVSVPAKLFFQNGINIIEIVIFLSIAYIVGLINIWISDGLFRGFRNAPFAIENELRKVLKANGNINLHNYVGHKYDSDKTALTYLPYICLKMLGRTICALMPCIKYKMNPVPYFQAYYALAQKQLIGSVPVLEAQVSLLRNMILPLVILAFFISDSCIDVAPGMLAINISIIIIFIVMIQRQNKIYQMVWEAANYYKL